MTGAGIAASHMAMRILLIPAALAVAFAALPVHAGDVGAEPESLVAMPPEVAVAPALLSPIAQASPWHARFAAAADELAAALRSRDEGQWRPLLGGPWLNAADADRIRTLLNDRNSPFLPALLDKETTRRAILGWSVPASLTAAERMAIEAAPEAEAIVCWSSNGAGQPWPTIAGEADNRAGRPYACARITYSIRDGADRWRAFIEQGADASLRDAA